jgi:hypothetical protein
MLCVWPAATATASVMPGTWTGRMWSLRVPSPSWPSSFRPQVQTVPLSFSAMPWWPA